MLPSAFCSIAVLHNMEVLALVLDISSVSTKIISVFSNKGTEVLERHDSPSPIPMTRRVICP